MDASCTSFRFALHLLSYRCTAHVDLEPHRREILDWYHWELHAPAPQHVTWDGMHRRLHENYGIHVSTTTLKQFIRNNPDPVPVALAVLPSPPHRVQRELAHAIANAIQNERWRDQAATQHTPSPSPSLSPSPSPSPLPSPRPPPVQNPPNLPVTPRTRRRAEVCYNRTPDSPPHRRLPRPIQPPRMQPLRPRVAPRLLIACELLEPTVDVTHRLEPFNARFKLLFIFSH